MSYISDKFKAGSTFRKGRVPGGFEIKLKDAVSKHGYINLKENLPSIIKVIQEKTSKIRRTGLSRMNVMQMRLKIAQLEKKEGRNLTYTDKVQLRELLEALKIKGGKIANGGLTKEQRERNIKIYRNLARHEEAKGQLNKFSPGIASLAARLKNRVAAKKISNGETRFASQYQSLKGQRRTSALDFMKKGDESPENNIEQMDAKVVALRGPRGASEDIGVKRPSVGFAYEQNKKERNTESKNPPFRLAA
ncbi:MAG: hypothetical protein PHT51_01250 [Patescibacteria group bacterium]|nr:hypothetical protein [Patescibacteria group bacterium]MDD4610500.1 hypothetical protein [Patescibacteria group bacterium]